MTLATYAGLIAEIWDSLDRDQVTDLAEGWIAAAESRMNAELRVRQMVGRSTATISAGFAAMPTDFLATRQMKLSASPYTLLGFLTQEQMSSFKATSPSGAVAYFSIAGAEFEFAPIPASDTDVELRYFAAIPALTTLNTTNWLLARYPLAYKRAAIVEAGLYYRDGELTNANEALFQDQLRLIRLNSRDDAFTLTPTPSAFAV